MVDKHIVANYLGDWSYYIIINQGVTNKDGNRIDKFKDENKYHLYFPLFMHTNGGYVFIYGTNNKDENTQNAAQKIFRDELKERLPGYPIMNVRSDAEPGFTNKLKILGENTTLKKEGRC